MTRPWLDKRNEKNYLLFMGLLSVLVPLSMALVLFTAPIYTISAQVKYWLPIVQVGICGAVLMALCLGFVAIKLKKVHFHRWCMLMVFGLICTFYISYLLYYLGEQLSFYGDVNADRLITTQEKEAVGNYRFFYFILLVLHTLLGVFFVPLLLLALYFGASGQVKRHQKVARWALPTGAFVALSYIILHFMMMPYTP